MSVCFVLGTAQRFCIQLACVNVRCVAVIHNYFDLARDRNFGLDSGTLEQVDYSTGIANYSFHDFLLIFINKKGVMVSVKIVTDFETIIVLPVRSLSCGVASYALYNCCTCELCLRLV